LTEPITLERDGHVLLIGVNRPAKRNAFNMATIEALGGAYESLGTDDELRAGVLFAHGDHLARTLLKACTASRSGARRALPAADRFRGTAGPAATRARPGD
jgi:enoyl-CoA hydratase/carnithine racemase